MVPDIFKKSSKTVACVCAYKCCLSAQLQSHYSISAGDAFEGTEFSKMDPSHGRFAFERECKNLFSVMSSLQTLQDHLLIDHVRKYQEAKTESCLSENRFPSSLEVSLDEYIQPVSL